MVIRVLGLIVGALLLAAPFSGAARFLDAAASDPKILLAPVLGIVFLAYGLGGTRLFSRLIPSWSKSLNERLQTRPPYVDVGFQQRLDRVTPKIYVTPALIAINVGVFLVMAVNGAGVFTPNPRVHLQWGSNFGPLTIFGQWWRLVTATFLHFGVLHLALNMWALYENGRIVERLYGNFYFLALYLFAGITGSAISVLAHPAVNSAGASGAIFGVLGALLAFTVIMHQAMPLAVKKAQRNSTLAFVGYALISGFSTPGIDNAAHLGGLAGGFLAGLLLARPLDPEQRKSGGVRRMAAVALVGLAGVIVSTPFAIGWTDAKTYLLHAAVAAQKGDLDGAIADATRAVESDPKLVDAYLLLGDVKAKKGDLEGAITDSSRILDLDAKSWSAYDLRAGAKSKRQDFEGAIADFLRGIEIKPDEPRIHNNLAWLLATAEQPAFRNGRRALEAALRACELTQWKNAPYLDTLAAAYARTGDFARAVEWQQKATADAKLKESSGARERLELYKSGKAWPPD